MMKSLKSVTKSLKIEIKEQFVKAFSGAMTLQLVIWSSLSHSAVIPENYEMIDELEQMAKEAQSQEVDKNEGHQLNRLAVQGDRPIFHGENPEALEEKNGAISKRDKDFGEYKIKFGLSRYQYDGGLKYYEDLFGSTPHMVVFKVDNYFTTSGLPLGISLSAGYSRDKGHASLTRDPQGANDLDRNQEQSLVLIPVQFSGIAQWGFLSNFIVWDLWSGMEALYVQEARHSGLSAEESDKNYVNSGYNYGFVFGSSLSFKIDQLEPRSRWTMKGLGIQSIYLSPFVEIVKTYKDKMGDYGRSTFGLLFSFETY